MSEERFERISKVARELNIGLSRAVDFLNTKGFSFRNDPNAKVTEDQYKLLVKEFGTDLRDKKEATNLSFGKKATENFVIETNKPAYKDEDEFFIKNSGETKQVEPQTKPEQSNEPELMPRATIKLDGPKVLGRIELTPQRAEPKPEAPQPKSVETPKPVIQEKPAQPVEEPLPVVSEPALPVEIAEEPQPAVLPLKQVENQPQPVESASQEEETELIEAKADTLKGLTVLGRMELAPEKPKPSKESQQSQSAREAEDKKKRKRIKIETKPSPNFHSVNKDSGAFKGNKNTGPNKPAQGGSGPGKVGDAKQKDEITGKEIQEQIKNTLARLSGGSNKPGVNRAKYRKEKRSANAEAEEERILQEQEDANILKVTEYISANDMASMMNVSVNQVIAACMTLGMFVSINQRLDAEAISIIAEEFNFKAQFTTAEEEIAVEDRTDSPEELEHRAPIVTIMGHVDHGKTSLLDYIRKSNVTSHEAGGITQHIGAYDVLTESGKRITFLDTPGHEAFTAMRARGAKVTDIVIIVVAADDGVMPQTKEAINHALVAGVPIIIAINKVDKPGANPEKIKEQLSIENILVEDWGGKYQCEAISAKSGKGVADLLEKVLLEAEILELKANPEKNASGTVIEAALDKGRGYVTTILVQTGTLKVGDIVLAGQFYGRVKAMNDHTGTRQKTAGPSKPVQILGLPGAPQAGDKFNVMETEAEAREIANKREQIMREQSIRTKKHITLDEIGRRLAIGNFQQLNVIIKGDFDGSIQAISDSLLKLSTNEIQVAIIHKGVGQISESDVLLASASDAVIIGFQVRPSLNAKKLADQEQIEIRQYSIIYDAINDLKDAMEGMLAPSVEEVILGTAEVREVFKITKVGTIAGCMVTDGNIKRQSELRLVRDGIVVFTGKFGSLKRFKDDVNEVKTGQDCGIGIYNYNDVQEGDTIEAFEKRETKRKL